MALLWAGGCRSEVSGEQPSWGPNAVWVFFHRWPVTRRAGLLCEDTEGEEERIWEAAFVGGLCGIWGGVWDEGALFVGGI
ncbi:hypothetical protein K456DRAFT_46186 [Colletotrichum gloeosporioides 23]|nr:hypothetical protein K456DRAFT_46186 [Colletotrichum gloeosporioides 23]